MREASAKDFASKWENTVEGVISSFQAVSTRKIASCVEIMTKRVKNGMSFAEAWNMTSVQLVAASEIHCRVIIITTFYEDIKTAAPTLPSPIREVLYQLVDLYAAYWAIDILQDLLKFTSMSQRDAESLQAWYEELLRKIRPNAVGLVDAFDVIDEFLQSSLGAYDGRVYERLMEEALKSPLNKEPVNRSFHILGRSWLTLVAEFDYWDGTYVKSKNEKLAYGTMVFVRVMILTDVAYEIARAATIAVRYAAVRHQSQPKPGQPEPAIINYVTQQHKLFIAIATSHAFRVTGMWLFNTYAQFLADMGKGKLDQLPELHALACCLKAVCSKDATARVDECRHACGGHGYMQSSNLPIINNIVTATVTYEGEFTVLMLQTARFLVKAWKQASIGKVMTPTVAYLVDSSNQKWQNNPEGIIRGFKLVSLGKIKAACEALEKHAKTGMDYEDAWNMASVQLVYASEYSSISGSDISQLQTRYEELLALIRPNAVGLVDAFDIRDEILASALGAYDGRVYERLMEEALKSPLNKEPVNRSFHMYLKPLMQAKL
ncbi:hypothetical protein O3G_MSEX011930 [Manduca sexta]|uniref:Acyl-coenzyme A oxidase n=1 Tax=Manduca sexta TaxID=7130 RepID=A0A922CVZ1_MANSE|nr:hypothetical protein O3G_MSEX011930 [Manduca sexta]